MEANVRSRIVSTLHKKLMALGPIDRVEAFVVDVNGIARGKWLPAGKVEKVLSGGLALPRSVFALDIEGNDVPAAGLAFDTGDPDGQCLPVEHTLMTVPWATQNAAQILMMMEVDGAPFFGDPRAILKSVVDRFQTIGLFPAVAMETEFFLLAGDAETKPATTLVGANVLSLQSLDEQEAFLEEMLAACDAQGLSLEAVLSENGAGQFEINVQYSEDALKAADDIFLLKRATKAIARRHNMLASFMAKPFGEMSGNGMHVHVSLLDAKGNPVFGHDAGDPNDMMRLAMGGLLTHMADCMLAFAPHSNSYRRFQKNSHAPCSACWGIDDRSAAVRAIIGGPFENRIEHRVAGADANPYLVLSLILAAILDGIENKIDPGTAQKPTDAGARGGKLPLDWRQAITRFETSDFVAGALGEKARNMISACKWQDLELLLSRVSDVEYQLYLSQV